jgi:hypothetical protein
VAEHFGFTRGRWNEVFVKDIKDIFTDLDNFNLLSVIETWAVLPFDSSFSSIGGTILHDTQCALITFWNVTKTRLHSLIVSSWLDEDDGYNPQGTKDQLWQSIIGICPHHSNSCHPGVWHQFFMTLFMDQEMWAWITKCVMTPPSLTPLM